MRLEHPSSATSAGFTLIEVLIAMALLSIMMLLLVGGMHTSVRNWDAGEQRILAVSKASAGYNFFRRQLATIQPLVDDFSDDEAVFSFQGGANSLQFVSALPASAGRFGLQHFTVNLVGNRRDGKQIQVEIKPFFPVVDGASWRGDQVVLVDRVETISFAYFGLTEREQEKRWHQQWLEQKQLPEIIKILIVLEGGVAWPAITVAPKIKQQMFVSSTVGEENNEQERSLDSDG